MSLSKEVDLAHAQRPVPCDACMDEVPGTYYCIECSKTFCEECYKLHQKFTKDHIVVPRTAKSDINNSILTCAEHGNRSSFHCEKCNIPVCCKCVTGKHQGHIMVDPDEFFKRKKKLLQEHVNEIQTDIMPTLIEKRNEILTKREVYDETIKQITKDIETENQDFHKKVDKIHAKKLNSLSYTKTSHLQLFDKCLEDIQQSIDMCEGRLAEYQDVFEKNNHQAVYLIAEGKEALPKAVRYPELPEPPSFISRRKQDIASIFFSIETYIQTSPTIISKFKSPIKGRTSICIGNKGDVWLGGDESSNLAMVNIKGQVLRKMDITHRTNALAIMDNGDVIISPHPQDSSILSKLTADGRKQHLFNASPSTCSGVSVIEKENILICTLNGRVMKANIDGTKVEQIYTGSGEGSTVCPVLHADGSSIYISDRKKSNIVLANNEGIGLLSITATKSGKKFKRPIGLVLDKLGNLLCADNGSDCVYIMDQNHLMKELVGRSHGIQGPRWLAVDNDNNLWITQYDGIVNVVKYIAD